MEVEQAATTITMESIAPISAPTMTSTITVEGDEVVQLEQANGAKTTDEVPPPATIPQPKPTIIAETTPAGMGNVTETTAVGLAATVDDEESPLDGVPREVSFSFSTDPGAGEEQTSTSRTGSLLIWTPEIVPSPKSATTGDETRINGTVSPYSDFLAKQSAEIKATKEKERQAQAALQSPSQSPPVPNATTGRTSDDLTQQPIGAVGAYSDFVTRQSAQLRAAKEKEREARASLSTPARAAVSSSPNAAPTTTTNPTIPGLVSPYGDFVAQQTAQNKKAKDAERQAREQLSAPIRSNSMVSTSSPIACDDSGGLAAVPHVDFMAQQTARLKAEKEQERMTRKMLNDGGITVDGAGGCLLNSFDAEQIARIKTTKEKERQAREMLSTPARANHPVSATAVEAGLVTPYADFQASQTAQIKAAKEKERQTRQLLNEPAAVAHGASPLSDFAAQQSAQIKAAKEKERETRASMSSGMSTTAESATDRLAAELLRRKEEAQQQLRSAMELKHGYHNGAPESATDRLAAEMKRQKEDTLQKKKEAEELSRAFRNSTVGRTASEQMADEMKRQKEETLRKRQEAEEYSRSFRNSTVGGAADAMADEMKRRKEEELRKKQEAEEYSRSYKTAAGESAHEVVAATLKRQKQFDLLRKKEAMTMTSTYRSASIGTDSAQERLAMEVKKRRDEEVLRKKQKEESLLKYVKELSERDHDVTEGTEDETSSTADMVTIESTPSALEHLKSKTETELEALRGGSTSLRDIASEFDRGIQSDGVERLKEEREQELRAVQASAKQSMREREQEEDASPTSERNSIKPGKLSDDVIRQVTGNLEETTTTAKTSAVEDELAILRQGNTKSAAAEFCRTASAREKYEQIKARTSSELANIQGGTTNMVERFASSFTSPGLEQIKSRTANELNSLSGKASSLRDLTAEFNRVSSSKLAVERLKMQTANELAAVRAEQRLANAEIEESEADNLTDYDGDSVAFSAEELASFQEEKTQREQELHDLRRLSSRQSLASIRSRTAEELEQVASQRKNSMKPNNDA